MPKPRLEALSMKANSARSPRRFGGPAADAFLLLVFLSLFLAVALDSRTSLRTSVRASLRTSDSSPMIDSHDPNQAPGSFGGMSPFIYLVYCKSFVASGLR